MIQSRPLMTDTITFKTLHITSLGYKDALFAHPLETHKKLMADLFKKYLIDDEHFHFFYEPEIIIRISNEDILDKITHYLSSINIKYLVYDYPIAPHNSHHEQFGETEGGFVIKYLPLFIPIFHAHSVAALSMDEADHFLYMERVVHTMWNPAAYSRAAEGEYLARLSAYKLDGELEAKNSVCAIL